MHFALRLSFEGTTVNLPDSGLNREVLTSNRESSSPQLKFEVSRILNELMQEGYVVDEDAIAAVSPYLTHHLIALVAIV